MSNFEIKMPKLGESITEGTILSWAVRVGDAVQEDEVLFEVNSAKVSAEIPSPVAGKVTEIRFKEGDTVAVGTVVALIGMDAERVEDTKEQTETKQEEIEHPQESRITEPPASEAPVAATAPVSAIAKTEDDRWFSPLVMQLAHESGIPEEELKMLPGTGFEGRVTKRDLQQYIQHRQDSGKSTPQSETASTTPVMAEAPVEIRQAASEMPSPVSSPDVEIREMDYVRKIIADHMVLSKRTSPHVTNFVEADVTRLVKWREANKDDFFRKEGVKLTYMPAITEAAVKALKTYPQINVSVDGYNIVYKKHIHISIAVSLDDGNLITPVIHDADRLSMSGLAAAVDTLAAKARAKKLTPEDIDGGTFTITNFGSFKSLFGTPIINQPQVAILGIGVIEKKPAVVETPDGDVIAIRHKMYLSLSYDHRVVDGSLAGNFLYAIKEYLENWPSK